MSRSNVIHVKLDYEEAINSKRDFLISQMNLLKMVKTIENYNSYRNEEIGHKLELQKRIRTIKTNMLDIQKILPALKIPEILKKEEKIEKKNSLKKQSKKYEKTLEEQLNEIRERLINLQYEKNESNINQSNNF